MSNKLRAVIGLILCLCLFFYSPNFSNNKSKALPSIASPRASLNRFVYAHLPFTISSYPRLPFITSTPKKFKESINPFEQAGRLVIDEKELQNNQWKPFKSAASHIMSNLYSLRNPQFHTLVEDSENFDWMHNKTILLLGDSIDRYFLKDWCTFQNGELSSIQNDHVAAPRPFRFSQLKINQRFGAQELRREIGSDSGNNMKKMRKRDIISREVLEFRQVQEHRERSYDNQLLTNPWVCNLEEFGMTLVSVFFFGTGREGSEEFFGNDGPFHLPAPFNDRVEVIAKPLLKNLAIHLNRPQITTPDLIQINSGFWDLRLFSQEDFKNRGYSAPYPHDTDVLRPVLSVERERKWEKSARSIIKNVMNVFPGTSPILWRTMNIPGNSIFAPAHRVVALNGVARNVVKNLQEEMNDSRLILNDFEKNLLGTSEFYRDDLHPNAIPASFLQGDRILWELKRAVELKGRD